MKKWKIVALMTLVMSIFIMTGCGNSSGSVSSEQEKDEGIKLRGSAIVNSESGWFDQITPWMEQVKEETNGKVQFDVFTSGELVAAGHSYDALNSGKIDIELAMIPSYEPERFPLSEVTLLPLSKSDASIAAKAIEMLMESDVQLKDGKTYYQLEYEDNGLVAFPSLPTEEYLITTTGNHFNSADDLSKLRLRAGSRVHDIFVKNIGANSISMPAIELYEALSRKALDGSLISIADWTQYGFQDIFKYTLEGVTVGHFKFVVAMKKDKWESLPEDVQESMSRGLKETLDLGLKGWEVRRGEGSKMYEEKGGQFLHINDVNPEVKDRLEQAIEQTWFSWIETLESAGHPGLETAKLWRDLIIQAGGDVPEGVKNL